MPPATSNRRVSFPSAWRKPSAFRCLLVRDHGRRRRKDRQRQVQCGRAASSSLVPWLSGALVVVGVAVGALVTTRPGAKPAVPSPPQAPLVSVAIVSRCHRGIGSARDTPPKAALCKRSMQESPAKAAGPTSQRGQRDGCRRARQPNRARRCGPKCARRWQRAARALDRARVPERVSDAARFAPRCRR